MSQTCVPEADSSIADCGFQISDFRLRIATIDTHWINRDNPQSAIRNLQLSHLCSQPGIGPYIDLAVARLRSTVARREQGSQDGSEKSQWN